MVFIYLTTIIFALILSALMFFLLHLYGQSLKSLFYDLLQRNFYFLREYNIDYWLMYVAVLLLFLSYVLINNILYAAGLTLALLFIFYLLLNIINGRMEKKLEREIPSFLRLLAASLQAGQSMQTALRDTVQGCQGPLKKEMNYLLRELQVGLSLNEALKNLRRRMPTRSMNMMTLSLEVAFKSGASIADLLNELADSINQELELHYKIQALSLQGRLQAYVLTAVPYVLLLVLYWVDEGWIIPFTQTLLGNLVLGFCFVMSAVGFYIIRKLVNIRI